MRKHVPISEVEKKQTELFSVETLRALARGEGLYLSCKYCGSTECKIAPLRPGVTDPAYAFPWSRRDPPIQETCRVVMTLCEHKEYSEMCAKRGGKGFMERGERGEEWGKAEIVRQEREAAREKPVLSAVEIAEKLLPAFSAKPRTVERLCREAGIEVSEKVRQVLEVFRKRQQIVSVMHGLKWRLAE